MTARAGPPSWRNALLNLMRCVVARSTGRSFMGMPQSHKLVCNIYQPSPRLGRVPNPLSAPFPGNKAPDTPHNPVSHEMARIAED